ncbi:MAG: hypothetical protein ACI8XB_000619 [Patiriisocius sp.]|jgi:hypothetical protein
MKVKESKSTKKQIIMKSLNKKFKLILTALAILMMFSSCTKDEDVVADVQSTDTTEIKKSSEVDKATEAMDDIALDVFEKQQFGEDNGSDVDFSSLPDCVTVTIVFTQNHREITIDFGTEGCEVNGNILKGKIILSYDRNPGEQEVLITKILEEFFFNDKNLVGMKTILKELSNDNGNPQFTHTTELTIIWPNGLTGNRSGTKVKEWVEGFGSGIYSDNVFEITGNWNSTFINGNSRNYEVLTPLRRQVICTYFVSGSIDVERPNTMGVMDYGDGDCDNIATFTTDDGEVIEIILN